MHGTLTPRDRLRAAIQAQAAAAEEVETKTSAVHRAAALCAEIETQLAQLENALQRVTDEAAASVKRWAAGDYGRDAIAMQDADGTLATDLVRGRARHAATKQAHASLGIELAQAKEQFTEAEKRVMALAVAIVQADGTTLGIELKQAQERVWQLQHELRGLGELWIGGSMIGLPQGVAALIDRAEPFYVMSGPSNPKTGELERWRQYLSQLTRNADAQRPE